MLGCVYLILAAVYGIAADRFKAVAYVLDSHSKCFIRS